MFVRAIRPRASTCGMKYALSTWHSARAMTGSDRSRLQPPSLVSCTCSAVKRPSASKPAFQDAWKGCRLPVMVRSSVRFNRSRTGRPVRTAPSAAIAAKPCGCISFPPKPPPMRRHCTVTSFASRPSTCAVMSCVSLGCCVLHWMKTCPDSSTCASEACVSR